MFLWQALLGALTRHQPAGRAPWGNCWKERRRGGQPGVAALVRPTQDVIPQRLGHVVGFVVLSLYTGLYLPEKGFFIFKSQLLMTQEGLAS